MGTEKTSGCTGEQTEVGSSFSKRAEGREIVGRESSEAYKTYSELLEQVHERYRDSVQMPVTWMSTWNIWIVLKALTTDLSYVC